LAEILEFFPLLIIIIIIIIIIYKCMTQKTMSKHLGAEYFSPSNELIGTLRVQQSSEK
jgi:hypothetical protein